MSRSPQAAMVAAGSATAVPPRLSARSLTAGYGSTVVVRDLDLDINAGEVVALLGPNGAGKSTTLLTLAGDLPPLSGEVLVDGVVTTAPLHRRAREGLAVVTEERSILSQLSVRDNLLLGRGGVEPCVEMFGELEPLLNRRAGLLSGGEQQMLALGRALATRPDVLLVDELSLGLAPLVVERLLTAVRRVADEQRVGVLLVEQQARRALRVADRWCLLNRGRVVATGDADDDRELMNQKYFGG